MINKIKHYIKRNNYSADGLADHLTHTGDNRRYKARLLAASTNNTSGIIQYRGVRYYYHCIAPWAYCPDGRIDVEIIVR